MNAVTILIGTLGFGVCVSVFQLTANKVAAATFGGVTITTLILLLVILGEIQKGKP